jgi:glutamate-ammonia-ligase adenylyltransferase
MGKHGGRELNYSSDIDLIILFDPTAPALGDPATAREIAVAAAKALVRILNDQTPDGYVFRTDLRLRPDPGVSAAAVSVRAAEAYYEAHGQNWERAAFIRARAAAGDIGVGEAFLERLRPFVWRRYLDYAAIEDIHSIKRQIHASKGGERIEFRGHDIKTGRGGIREIEFFAQTQQLILGGRNRVLREAATIPALAALRSVERISEGTHSELAAAYRYLRRVEHRLQMLDDEQTHRIPRDEAGVERLAAFLNEKSAVAFEEKLVEVLKATHRRFSELFEREERLSSGAGSLIFTGVENDKATLATLSRLGFKRPADISETVRRWHTGSLRATRSPRARELLTKLGPRILEELAKAGDPDAAFVAFDQFLAQLPAGVQVFSLFANNPQIFETLIRIMTISPFLGRELSKRAHLIEALLESRWPQPALSAAAMQEELADRLDRAPTFETKLNAARRWGSEHRFETAAQLAIGLIGSAEAAARFTAQADVAINAVLPVALKETEAVHGAIDGALVVVGMGRLGAEAMTATSDVDLVFIYEAADGAVSKGPKPVDGVTYFMRVVRRFLTALTAATEEGALYEVDMQLRPSGSKGPWAVSFGGLERYYAEEAWTWEAMALTKARIIAGDDGLAPKVRSMIDAVLSRPRPLAPLARDVEDMRRRVREAKPPAGPWDVKLAEGGLTELDFILAFLNLKEGAVHGAPPTRALDAMRSLLAKGALSGDHAEELVTALDLFETIMQLSRAATGDLFAPDTSGEALRSRMAAACGASTIAEAEEKLMARQRAVRMIYKDIVVAASPNAALDAP